MAKELSCLEGSRIQKIHSLGHNEFRFKLYSANSGDSLLLVDLKKRVALTKLVKEAPQSPPQLVMLLRKRLGGAVVKKVSQHGLDRVLFIDLDAKDGSYRLVFEMFSKGNLILLDEKGVVVACMRSEEWKDRKIKPRHPYSPPATSKLDPRDLTEAKLSSLLNDKKIVACLASCLNLGSLFVEEALTRAGVDYSKKASSLSPEEIAGIHSAIHSVFEELSSPTPRVFYEEGKAVDYSPIRLESKKGLEEKEFPTLSEALDEYWGAGEEKEFESKLSKKKGKLEQALEIQLSSVSEFEGQAEEAKLAGDKLYEHYQEVEAVTKAVRQLHESGVPWERMLEELKKQLPEKAKCVKEVRAEGGVIVFEF